MATAPDPVTNGAATPASGSATNSPIVSAYRERTPRSATLAEQAREAFPSGLTHDGRRLDPYPLYVDRASGSRKWDVDGNEYVDYFGGHGALLLGHNHPEVMAAVARQLERGTHFGACHELELAWGQQVLSMVPSAERMRFTSSGTEANLMALRLARAFTGKKKVVRFLGHFHGWQDHAAFGYDSHFDGTPTPGVLDGIAENVLLAPSDDWEATQALLESRDDIAMVMLEPTGANFGVLPMSPEFVRRLREITARLGVVLLFDEVVTGFRVAPGGAQEMLGVTPDLSAFAKILSGGLPGGAVAGRRDIMELLDFDASASKGREKIGHQGTFNANPVSAAAGATALGIVASTDACAVASAQAARLRGLLNEMFSEEGIRWAAYGEHSGVYVFTNPDRLDLDPLTFDAAATPHSVLRRSGKGPHAARLRLALLVNGVDMTGKPGGTTSCMHTDADIELTRDAARTALRMLRDEGELD